MFTESVRIGCSFLGLSWWISKISNNLDISPTLPNSVSGSWLFPPGKGTDMGLYGLLDTLPVLSYIATILF